MASLKMFLGFVLCLTVGCNSLPPPRIEEGRYIHPKHQISFEAPPAPWFQSEDLPDRFIPKSDSWRCTLGVFNDVLFVNDARNGAIAVEATKTWRDLGVIPPQRIEAIFSEAIKEGLGVRKAPFISDYNFKITAPYVCDIPLPLIYEDFTMKSQRVVYRCEIRTYVYTINEDDTCFLHLTLWSAPATYAQNRIALDNLAKTLQRTPPVSKGSVP